MRISSYPAFHRYNLTQNQSMPSVAPRSLADQRMAPAIASWVIGYPFSPTQTPKPSQMSQNSDVVSFHYKADHTFQAHASTIKARQEVVDVRRMQKEPKKKAQEDSGAGKLACQACLSAVECCTSSAVGGVGGAAGDAANATTEGLLKNSGEGVELLLRDLGKGQTTHVVGAVVNLEIAEGSGVRVRAVVQAHDSGKLAERQVAVVAGGLGNKLDVVLYRISSARVQRWTMDWIHLEDLLGSRLLSSEGEERPGGAERSVAAKRDHHTRASGNGTVAGADEAIDHEVLLLLAEARTAKSSDGELVKEPRGEVLMDRTATTESVGERADAAESGVEHLLAVRENADLGSVPRVLVDGRDGALVDSVRGPRSEGRLCASQ